MKQRGRVHGCMGSTMRRGSQQFHVAPAMYQPNGAVSAPLRWIFKARCKLVTHSESREQEGSESPQEQRIALYKSDEHQPPV